jgi:predicted TIM-barrel fold metal-dependent hydrolase
VKSLLGDPREVLGDLRGETDRGGEDEVAVAPVRTLASGRTILFASDYPHPDGYFPGIAAALGDRTDVADSAKVKILRYNAVRCFGLDS